MKDWQARVVPEEKVGAGVYNAPIGFADATATAARFAVVTDPAHFVYNIGAHACAGVPQKCSDLQVMAASFQERLLVAWEAGGPPPLREAQFVHSLAATPESRAGLVREAGGVDLLIGFLHADDAELLRYAAGACMNLCTSSEEAAVMLEAGAATAPQEPKSLMNDFPAN